MRILHVILALILVPIFLFSAFGFFASFESREWGGARVVYAVLAIGSIGFILWTTVASLRNKP